MGRYHLLVLNLKEVKTVKVKVFSVALLCTGILAGWVTNDLTWTLIGATPYGFFLLVKIIR